MFTYCYVILSSRRANKNRGETRAARTINDRIQRQLKNVGSRVNMCEKESINKVQMICTRYKNTE